MNLTKEEQDRLIEIAKEKYPVGTELISVELKDVFNSNGKPYFVKEHQCLYMIGHTVWRANEWAEILPNETLLTHKVEDEEYLTDDEKMIERLKSEITRLESELKDKTELINKVLNLSVEQIYFNDSADYLTAHYEIVHKIRPDLGDLDEDIIKEIYHGLKQ